MMYYIDKPNTWRPANKKCAEIQEYVNQFRNCLIADDLSRDALIQDIRHKVEELNKAYPRTKKLVVRGEKQVICFPEGRPCEYENVFIIEILPVHRTYSFAEQTNVLEKGGQQ